MPGFRVPPQKRDRASGAPAPPSYGSTPSPRTWQTVEDRRPRPLGRRDLRKPEVSAVVVSADGLAENRDLGSISASSTYPPNKSQFRPKAPEPFLVALSRALIQAARPSSTLGSEAAIPCRCILLFDVTGHLRATSRPVLAASRITGNDSASGFTRPRPSMLHPDDTYELSEICPKAKAET